MKFTLIFSIKWVHALPKLTGEGVSPQLINWVCRAFGDLQMEGAKQRENYNFPPLTANPGPVAVCKSTTTQLNSCRYVCYSGALTGLNNFQMEFLGSLFDLPIHYLLLWMRDGLHKAACCCCCLNGRKFIRWANNESPIMSTLVSVWKQASVVKSSVSPHFPANRSHWWECFPTRDSK